MSELKRQIRSMMLEDLIGQGDLVLDLCNSIEAQVQTAVDNLDLDRIDQIYMVGAGDSYYTGLATRLAVEKYAGIPAEPIECLEFSRYHVPYVRKNGLLIGVSISGQVGRSLDAIRTGMEHGLTSIGLTATPGSTIFGVADEVIDVGVRVREPGPVPQTYHFLANLTAMYLLALTIGVKRGHITQTVANEVKANIRYNLETISDSAKALVDPVMEFASRVKNDAPYVIVGGGPNFGTALFGVAKLIEAAVMGSIAQELEEWAHEQYFITGPGVHTFVISPFGLAHDRAIATLASIRTLGGTAVAVGVEGDEPVGEVADVLWAVKTSEDELLSPMNLKLPLEIFAYAIAEVLDIRPFNYDDEVRKKTCENNIYADGESAETVARKQWQKGHDSKNG